MNSLILITCLLTSDPTGSWEWVSFRSEDGQFKSSFPNQPVESQDTIQTEIGEIAYHSFMSKIAGGKVVMGVSYNDYPKDIQKKPSKELLDSGRDGAIENLNGKLLTEADFTFQGYPGREFSIVAGQGENRIFYLTRVFIVGPRMYQLQVMRVGDEPLDVEVVAKFFAAFEVTE